LRESAHGGSRLVERFESIPGYLLAQINYLWSYKVLVIQNILKH